MWAWVWCVILGRSFKARTWFAISFTSVSWPDCFVSLDPGVQIMRQRLAKYQWMCTMWDIQTTFMCQKLEFGWRKQWHPTPVVLPGKSQGRRCLGRLPSMGSHRVGHDWSDLAAAELGSHLLWQQNWAYKKKKKLSLCRLFLSFQQMMRWLRKGPCICSIINSLFLLI